MFSVLPSVNFKTESASLFFTNVNPNGFRLSTSCLYCKTVDFQSRKTKKMDKWANGFWIIGNEGIRPLILQIPRNALLCHGIFVVPSHKQSFQMKELAFCSRVCYLKGQPALYLLSEWKCSSQFQGRDDWASHLPLAYYHACCHS